MAADEIATDPKSNAGAEVALGCVVIGRNEGGRLVRCLESLRGMGSVVYVDSGSSDGSVDAARRLGAAVVELDMATPFTAARARNEGFAALKSSMPQVQFVQFVDGDCELAPGWIGTALAAMAARPQAAAVCGRRRERHPDASVYNWLCDLEWNTRVGEAAACGGDSLMRAAAFEAAGGFNPQLMAGEEPDLCARLREAGWTIWRLDAEMTLHDAAMNRFRQWWMRSVRGGFGYAQAWDLSRRRPIVLYRQELKRALLWAGALPVLITVAAVLHPLAGLALAAAYPLQIMRIALRRGIARRESWVYAWFMVLAKFAELYGALRYFRRPGRARRLIDYKAQ